MSTFILIGENKCPNCGVKGNQWKKKPEVYMCPACNSFFNEFGMVFDSRK